MKNTSSISVGVGYVRDSLGDQNGDLAPTYNVTLFWPPDMAGQSVDGVQNDARVQEGVKVRPAPRYRPALVFWVFGSRTVWVVGERIIFGGCNPDGAAAPNAMDDRDRDERTPKNALSLSTAGAGGSPPGGL